MLSVVSGRERKVQPVVLPKVDWRPTTAKSSRDGHKVERVVLHRWGVKYVNRSQEAASYQGVIRFFSDRRNDASAHFVMPGSAVPGRCTQMVPYSEAAWTQAAYNRTSVEIECADAIWLGYDPYGLQVTARMTAFLLHRFGLPAVWSKQGFCRHADLGALGGGHTSCPTTDLHVWKQFVHMVKFEAARGDFLRHWGR